MDAVVAVAYTRSGGRITSRATTTGSGADARTSTEWYLPSGVVDHVDETQGSTTRTVVNTYDAVGRVKTQTVAGSPASTMTYTYNQAGNVIQVDYPAVGSQGAKVAKTWWNLAGVPTHLTLTNGSYWRLGHDQAGRLSSVELAYGAWVPVGAYTLDGTGQPLVETLNSGSGGMNRTTTRRPATGQVAQVNQVVDNKTCTWALTNDNAGRIKTIAQTSATNQTCDQPGQTTTFGYDAASQLTSATNTGTVPGGRPKSWAYTYGNTGNRLTETTVRKGTGGGADTTTTTVSRYSGGRLCATGATLPASCSAASGVTTYGYDTAGRRTSVGRPTGQPSTTYTYDSGGRLASTSFTPIGGGTDTVTRGYDPAGSMILDLHTKPNNTTEELISYWDHTGATPVPQVMTTAINGTSYQLSYGYERITSTANWYAYDPLGSVLATSTNPLAPNEYDPYGAPVGWPVDFGWNYFGYRGEWGIGDHLHLRNRDYDYRTATFLTHDPLDGVSGSPVESNPYHYADNDPLNKTDPLGLRPRNHLVVLDIRQGGACPAGSNFEVQTTPPATSTAASGGPSVGSATPVCVHHTTQEDIDRARGYACVDSTWTWKVGQLFCEHGDGINQFLAGVVVIALTVATVAGGYELYQACGTSQACWISVANGAGPLKEQTVVKPRRGG